MSVLRKSLNSFSVKKFCYLKSCPSNFRNMRLCRTYCSSEALSTPAPDGSEKIYPPKIMQIVEQISKLTLIEVADLNECVQKTFRIKDMPMAMGAMPMAGVPAAAAEEVPESTKSSFTVKLLKYEDTKKVAVIKEIKSIIDGLNLVQAKKFVEAVPQIIKGDIGKDEAENLKKQLEAVGGTCEIS